MLEVPENLPEKAADLRVLLASREVEIIGFKAELRSRDLLIEKLKHQLAGLRRHQFGSRSESLDQLELTLEEEEIARAAEAPAPQPSSDDAEEKQQPKRRPLPDHLPRNETVLEVGDACASCGGKLKRLGEDVTEELEYVPGRFVVNRIVRPRMACSCCERITQAALPSRPIERGRPGPGLLAHVLVNKYADHLPLYRQSQIFEREGVDLERSTLADWVGKSTALLEPLADAIGRHVLRGDAIFADDTPVKMQAPGSGRTKTARFWTYARDDRPWAGDAPPAAWYQFSVDRRGEHPEKHLAKYKGWMHADGYAGFNDLYRSGDVHEVACMAHIRRKFVDVQQSQGSAIAEEAIRRIAELYAVEKEARGSPPDERVRLRQAKAKPILDDLDTWLGAQLTRISGKTPLAQAIRYAITRIKRLRPYLDHGFLEADNNTAERAMRAIAIGRKNWLFAGSERGGRSAAIAYTLIETAKLNGIDPQAWLTDVLKRIADHKITLLDELMPWRYAHVGRAGVDSAEIAGKMLRIAEEQLGIAKDQKKASYVAAATFAQTPKSSSAPTPPAAEARTAPEKPQAAVAPSRDPAPSLVMKKKEPEVFGRAPTLETIEHDGTTIRKTDDAFFIGELRFAEIEPAKAFIDANLSKANKGA